MYMKKYLLFLSLAVLLAACNGITYEGEFSKDGYYTARPVAYFLDADTFRLCTFAYEQSSVESKKYEIPIQFVGGFQPEDVPVKVTVDPASTAIKDKHYASVDVMLWKKGEMTATLQVTALRNSLSKEELDNIYLILNVEPTEEYRTDSGLPHQVKVQLADYLKKPDWWDNPNWEKVKEDYYGEFTNVKYLKWLEFYQYDEKELTDDLFSEKLTWPQTFKLVYNYFKEHPELNQVFGPLAGGQ